MECPFKTPAKYEMKITNTEYIVVDAERKVIAKCNYEDDALFIQNVINCHEKYKLVADNLTLITGLLEHPGSFVTSIDLENAKQSLQALIKGE